MDSLSTPEVGRWSSSVPKDQQSLARAPCVVDVGLNPLIVARADYASCPMVCDTQDWLDWPLTTRWFGLAPAAVS